MRRPFLRLAAACAFAVAMTAFTGSALAGNGNGNGADTAPGQQKKDQAGATQAPAPAAAQPQQTAQTQSAHEPPGQAKKQQSTSSAQSSTQLGVKPSSKTTKWTHCVVGQTAGVTTCTSSDNGHTPQPNVDASKKYGNGKTAAQIVVSRGGANANVQLTGPGNSQPHKVTACGKPNNKSGGVDVHAIKSYLPADCAQAPKQAVATAPEASCGFVMVATTSEVGKSHGHGKGLVHNKHEKSTTSFSLQPDSTQSCNSAAAVAPTQQAAVAAVAAVAPATPVAQSSPATQSSTAAPVTKSAAGGVLGVQTTLASPKPARGGVLGTVTNVAGSSLPFTGFPIWLAVVIAVALILAGTMLRRRAAVTRV